MSDANDIDDKLSFLASIDGTDFLARMRGVEDECVHESLSRLAALGERAPKCYAHLGRSIAMLDSLASCFFGCRGGDHTIEYLAGRIVSLSLGGLRLCTAGYYDESLTLIRNGGEIANLLVLFVVNANAISEWKTADRNNRLKAFSPVKVRLALEALGVDPPISQDRYTWFCEGVAHGTPSTKPQSYNVLGVPNVGGRFQEAGLMLCLNEAAIVVGFTLPFTAKLVDASKPVLQLAKSEALALESYIGGVRATEIDKYWEDARSNINWHEIRNALDKPEPD